MKRLLGALVPLLLFGAAPPAASAGESELIGLHVEGQNWHAENRFVVAWDGTGDGELWYRFVDLHWAEAAVNSGRWASGQAQIAIPPPPDGRLAAGEYEVEMWLSKHGSTAPPGPSSYVTLRYDGTTPSAPGAAAPSGWLDGRATVAVTVSPPTVRPVSGIHGYAISVSGRPGESPCAIRTICTDAELALPGGVDQHQLQLGRLPEGVNYVNVVTVAGTGIASPPTSVPVRIDISPPRIHFAGVSSGWVDHPVPVTAVADDPLSGMAASGPNGPFTKIAVDGGVPTLSFDDRAVATVSGEGTHLVAGWGRDVLGNAGDAATAQSATVRIDETPPRVAFAAAQRPDDPELIELWVADALAGPSVDHGSIEVRPAGTAQRFQPLPTAATAGGLAARWNSDDFPRGNYEFRAIGFDAAGNPAVTERRVDGSPMVLRNPVKIPVAVESGFGGAHLVWQHCRRVHGGRRCRREAVTGFDARPALWTVPYGRRLRFGGVLRAPAGAPLAGQPVEIVETFAPGAALPQRRTTVTSGANGRFDTRLAPGPSRRVEAIFPGTPTLTRGAGRPVTMAVRAGVRLRASTTAARIGGRPVIFSGRLLAGEATVPRTGRPIQLQFRVPGGEWSEFRTVQTDRGGRFRYAYAFTDDDSRRIRFQFRAVSPEQSDWPYRPSASAPVAVTGY
ncbi:MAG: hypothetical protein JST31_14890 [Actinobacteria bacterium]|nr:hypothetical protein [Actinomycetota bacterium]